MGILMQVFSAGKDFRRKANLDCNQLTVETLTEP
jgi:hypothetical protein